MQSHSWRSVDGMVNLYVMMTNMCRNKYVTHAPKDTALVSLLQHISDLNNTLVTPLASDILVSIL